MEISQHIDRFTFVPNFFTLNIGDLPSAKLKVIQQKLEDKDDELTTDNVKLMNSNLLSFVLLLFGKYTDSKRQNEIMLKETPSNINANVIKGMLCFKNGEIIQAESCIKQIKENSEDEYLVTEAHAEIAYAYSRFGGSYYTTAIATYLNVTEKFPEVYEWKFRFALTIRRCLRLSNIDIDEFFPKCLNLLTDIIDNSDDTYLIANAYVQKACLLIPINSSDIVLKKYGISNRQQTIVENLDKAMELTTEDAGMLQEAGRCLRNIQKFKAAKVILEKAINICPTSTSYHQLALCLIKLEGYSPVVVYSLERSVEMNDFNTFSKLDLGKAYMNLKIPDFTKALQCFESCQANNRTETGYGVVGLCYDLMAQCYFKMANAKRRWVDRKTYMDKFQENRRKSVIESAIDYLNALRIDVEDEQKLEIDELFSNDKPRFGWTPKDNLLRYVYYNISHNCDFICEVKHACLSGAISVRIQNYIQHGQLSECLDMMILLMTTDIPDIESKAIETIGQIIYESVLQSNESITQNCTSCTIRCFYHIDQNDFQVRIIHDDNSQTEADRMENITAGLDLRVIRNKLDILPFMNPETALLSAMSNNIVVLYIVKDNNTSLLEEYSVIRQLPISKPVLIPITVNDSFVPNVLSSHTDPMKYPNTNLTAEQKAIWYETIFEKIFNPFKPTATRSVTNNE